MSIPFPINIPPDCPFSIQNLPFGIFSQVNSNDSLKVGVAVGGFALDLEVLEKAGLFKNLNLSKSLKGVFANTYLNDFAAFPAEDRCYVRHRIVNLLTTESSSLFTDSQLNKSALVPLENVRMHAPFKITDYTDFFSSVVHAENATRLLNIGVPSTFFEYPMGYNGRISSIKVTDTDVIRPKGFFKLDGAEHPTYQPSRKLDFEIEIGAFVSTPIEAGETANAREAADHIFGYVLLNDWSARDIQAYEMEPFGPFHSKSFLTSISPWVVTPDALKTSRAEAPLSSSLSHLAPTLMCGEEAHGCYNITFTGSISRDGGKNVEIARTNMKYVHWTVPQMIAYQSSSGCGIHTGDLLGSGTMSSPRNEETLKDLDPAATTFGCLAEVNALGDTLPKVNGEEIKWLEDGDRFSYEGWFQTADGGKGGFGGVTGLVVPARASGINGAKP